MGTPVLSIQFLKSKSKNYSQVLRTASRFEMFETKGETNTLRLGLKEIFEKWDDFNLLFWKVVDWKGTMLEYNGLKFQAHSDKTRIFYALQESHSKLFFFTEEQIKGLYKVYRGECRLNELDFSNLPDKDIDYLLDSFILYKNTKHE